MTNQPTGSKNSYLDSVTQAVEDLREESGVSLPPRKNGYCRLAGRTTLLTFLFSPGDRCRLYLWYCRVSLRANIFGSKNGRR